MFIPMIVETTSIYIYNIEFSFENKIIALLTETFFKKHNPNKFPKNITSKQEFKSI